MIETGFIRGEHLAKTHGRGSTLVHALVMSVEETALTEDSGAPCLVRLQESTAAVHFYNVELGPLSQLEAESLRISAACRSVLSQKVDDDIGRSRSANPMLY